MSESNGSMNKEKLIADMKQIVADADALLQATADQTSEKIAGLRTRLQDNLKTARSRLAEAETTLVDKTAQATRDALQKSRTRPIKQLMPPAMRRRRPRNRSKTRPNPVKKRPSMQQKSPGMLPTRLWMQ